MAMNHETEKKAWTSVPQFGGWDKGPGATNYSMVFSQARANRKQHKIEIRRSLGSQQELIAASLPLPRRLEEDDSVSKKRKILTFINCCIRP